MSDLLRRAMRVANAWMGLVAVGAILLAEAILEDEADHTHVVSVR